MNNSLQSTASSAADRVSQRASVAVRVTLGIVLVLGVLVTVYTSLLLVTVISGREADTAHVTVLSFLAINLLLGIALCIGAIMSYRRKAWGWYLSMALLVINLLYSLWPTINILSLVLSGLLLVALWRYRSMIIGEGIRSDGYKKAPEANETGTFLPRR